jgi:hypothetical protein
LQQGHSGFLVGYDRGEWGGSLLWCTNDGSVKRELLDDNVVAIVPLTDRFLVLAGLSHLGSDRGRVVELLDDAGGFRIGRRTELGSAPSAAVVEPDGAFLIVTMHGLVRLPRCAHTIAKLGQRLCHAPNISTWPGAAWRSAIFRRTARLSKKGGPRAGDKGGGSVGSPR